MPTAGSSQRILEWVAREVLPHEASLRFWLNKTFPVNDLEDVIQEAYCRISALKDVEHIRSGRAYLFKTARMVLLERMRRSKIVSIETVAEMDALGFATEEPSPERVAIGRSELARVQALLNQLPERCRHIVELRKIQGLSQREVAHTLGITEHIVENEVARALRILMAAVREGDAHDKLEGKQVESHGRTRNSV